MEYVTNLPRNLLLLFAIIAILVIGYKMIVYYAEHQPIYDPLVHGPEDQQEIAAKHVDKRMPKCLRLYARCMNQSSANEVANEAELINQAEQDRRMAKALRDATHAPTYYQAGMLQNNPTYFQRGIENSDEARRLNAATERQMAADTIKGKRP